MAAPRKPEKKDLGVKEFNFIWEGKDKSGKIVRGEMRAAGGTVVSTTLRRQGILPVKIKKQSFRGGGKVSECLSDIQVESALSAAKELLRAS